MNFSCEKELEDYLYERLVSLGFKTLRQTKHYYQQPYWMYTNKGIRGRNAIVTDLELPERDLLIEVKFKVSLGPRRREVLGHYQEVTGYKDAVFVTEKGFERFLTSDFLFKRGRWSGAAEAG